MKINNKLKKKNYRLLRFNLINSNFIKCSTKPLNENIEDFEVRFKQILRLIYDFHFKKKKIYFVDFPIINDINFLKTFHQNNHKFLSHDMIMRKIKNRNKLDANLIVFFNNDIKLLVLNNLLKLNVPLVSFSDALLIDKSKFSKKDMSKNSFLQNVKLKQFTTCLFYSLLKILLWFL